MLGTTVNHRIECVSFHTLQDFADKIKNVMGDVKVKYDEENKGVYIYERRGKRNYFDWSELASILEWFDDAEIITDNNENEKVMTWLNVD